jgi:hypothetical protein
MFKSSQCPHGRLTFCLMFAGRWCRNLGWHSDHLFVHHQWEYSCLECARALTLSKLPIAPMGKLLTCSPRLTLAQLRLTLWSTTVCTCQPCLQHPNAPMENCLRACLDSRLHNCERFGHHMPKSTLIFQFESIFGPIRDGYASHACKLPIAPMENCLRACLDSRLHNCERFGHLQAVRATETFKSSHRPNGRLTFCSLLAGRWCRNLGWHSDHLFVHHQWEHS